MSALPAAVAISAELELRAAERIADVIAEHMADAAADAADAADADNVAAAILGVQSDDATTMTGKDLSPGRGRVTVYVAPEAADAVHAAFAAMVAEAGAAALISATRIEPEDWNATWKAHFRALDIGARLRVEPPWDRHPAGDRVVIVVDPGMAFGTGSHETTRMAATLLEAAIDGAIAGGADPAALRLLDVGTGSGLLAMAGVALGVGAAVGVDNDAVAIASAAENVALNGMQDRVALHVAEHPDALAPGRYPLVLANIISSVLLRLRDGLLARVAPGGLLLLSGVLGRERDAFVDAFMTAGPGCAPEAWTLETELELGEWKGFALRRLS